MRRSTATVSSTLDETIPTVSHRGNVRLKIAIIKRGILQCTLAERLQISPYRLSRIVRGHSEPTADEEDRLAELLGESRRSLFRRGVGAP